MAMPKQKPSAHIGLDIRQSVIPTDLSVTEAAKKLGVGRPALSNLLNGKSTLSPEMAMRLQKVFGTSTTSSDLLKKQDQYNKDKASVRKNQIMPRPYAPVYLQITAGQIATWSETIPARSELGALLRILVHSTCSNLKRVDFPAFDNSQQEGWDGWIDSNLETPWIPRGISGWEFSCNKTVQPKADADYAARTRKTPSDERKITTFIFVTTRNWPKKKQWIKSKKDLGLWKDVWAFDASDLEQWLEQSISARVRFWEFQGVGRDHILSLDQIWSIWASTTEPNLSRRLFVPTSERHRGMLEKWFDNPPIRPLIVSGDSSTEALAFLACAIDQFCPGSYDRTIVIRSRDAFNSISNSDPNFVAIIASSEVEQDLAGLHKKTHTIIVRENSTQIKSSDITLDPLLSQEDFQNALKEMGVDDRRISQLARESARSPSILRRRLSVVPAVQCPPWMENDATVRMLIPLMFAGAWDSNVIGDQEILCRMTGSTYPEVERMVTLLQQTQGSPIWLIDSYRGVVSKIDTLDVAKNSITPDDLSVFLSVAKEVLSEPDPEFNLPGNRKWTASFYGETRKYSPMLRQGICDTLVLIAVHGNDLFKKRIGMNLEEKASKVVNCVLSSSNESTWLSQQRDLPRYAEAAPETFLSIVEKDINSKPSKIAKLFAPVESIMFGGCPRAELLWALELVAWKPQRLMRVVFILARLCDWKIDDNWTNTPWATLASIFSVWPQTVATLDQRNQALVQLAKKFPKVGWTLCVGQIRLHPITSHTTNCRPRWRADADGASEVFITLEERKIARSHAIKIALNWTSYNPDNFYNSDKLGDLIECLGALCEKQRDLLWDRVVAWNNTAPIETQKAMLRERIRFCFLTRHSRPDDQDDALRSWVHNALALLEPTDIVARYSWLFLRRWVEPSADEIEGNELDYRKRDQQIEQQRREALKEIWQKLELEGILNLCRLGEASGSIGFHFAEIHTGIKPAVDFVQELLLNKSVDIQNKINQCIMGFLNGLSRQQRSDAVSQLIGRLEKKNQMCVRMLLCAPFEGNTWRHVDGLSSDLKKQYWEEINPHGWGHENASDVIKIVDELLEVNRPRAAFFATHLRWNLLDSRRLVCLLNEVATNDSEPPDHYQVDSYYISEALDMLEERGDLSHDELAQLEFTFINVLGRTKHGIRNLEAQLAKTPALFMQILALVFKRNDGVEDSSEGHSSNSDHRARVGSAAYLLLTKANRVPGTQADGNINLEELKDWLEQTRNLARQHGRADIGDQMIGQLLSHCRIGDDGVWPCEPVREAIEDIESNEIGIGMSIGIRNSRGVTLRGKGGDQERQLADQFRGWSEKIAFVYPYTSDLLEQIARSYESEMEWWDVRANVTQRLEN